MLNCIFTIGSVTQAMKAEGILKGYSIPCEVIKLSASRRKNGCIYGIRFACMHSSNVSRILSAAKIHHEEYSE